MNRIGIFSYKKSADKVDAYIKYILEDMNRSLSYLVIVVSKDTSSTVKEILYGFADEVIICDNTSLVAAYKAGINHLSKKENFLEYDELVLFEDSFYGPLCTFEEIFRKAEQELPDADLWGISCEYVEPQNITGCSFNLQLYFLVVRKKLLQDRMFFGFWSGKSNTSNDSTLQNSFSQYFSHIGFQVGSLYRTNYMSVDATIFDAYTLIKQGFPIIKRAIVLGQYHDIFSHAIKSDADRVLEYIKYHTCYDINLIFDNAIRVSDPYNLLCNLGNHFIIREDVSIDDKKLPDENLALMVFHLHYEELFDKNIGFLSALPDEVDILITTTSIEKVDLMKHRIDEIPELCNRTNVILSEGNGRDVAALLVEASPFLRNYKYIGFTHDKLSLHLERKNVEGFAQMITENIFGEGEYVRNVLKTLESNPRLGLLMPYQPFHGLYFGIIGRSWLCNYRAYHMLCQRLGIEANTTADSVCISLGTAFWCRYDALRTLFEYPWIHDDFPAEPMPTDGTISHAIERSFPFISKYNGYCCGFISTPHFAEVSMNNNVYICNHLMKNLNRCISSEHSTLTSYVKRVLDRFVFWGRFNNSSHLKSQLKLREKNASIIRRSRYFNKKWYAKKYPDSLKYKNGPEYHYLEAGWKSGCDPSVKFSSKTYLQLNNDVKRSGMCPLLHYECFGRREGRPYKIEKGLIIRAKAKKFGIRTFLSKAKDFLRKVKYYFKNWDINENKIVFRAFQNDYTCNPKYICEEIIRQHLPYEMVWLANQNGSVNSHFPKEVKIVRVGTSEALNEIMSAKILIDNGALPFSSKVFKKKCQVSINTWHGSFGFKRLDGNQKKKGKKGAKLYGLINDYIVSNSTFEDNVFRNAYWKNNRILQCGHPRNDILISCSEEKREFIKNKVYKTYNIPAEKKLVLYASTYKEKLKEGSKETASEAEEINLDMLCDSLQNKFGGEWCVMVRAHYVNSKAQNTLSAEHHKIYDVTAYPDIQELMLVADVGVTDYSSWILDFMLTRKPAFLYTPDYDDYNLQRGFYYPLSTAPFPIGKNNEELSDAIVDFDMESYKKKVDLFLEEKGSREDGGGSKAVVELIKSIMGHDEGDIK